MAARITLFSSPGCAHCQAMKRWLQQRNIPFRELNINASPKAMKAFQQAGGRGVPLLRVGEQSIQGFEPKKLARQLRSAGVRLE